MSEGALPVDPALLDQVWASWPIQPTEDPIEEVAGPSFPMDSLPKWIAANAKAVAGATQTPEDYSAMMSLAVLAAVCGGRVWARGNDSWVEPTGLFIAVVAAPGNRKSPVVTKLTEPMIEWEKRIRDRAKATLADSKTKARLARVNADKAALAAEKNPDNEELVEKAARAEEEAADAEDAVRRIPRVMAGDVTPEKLAELMADNDGRIALMSDEGGIFDTMSGKYSATPNLEPFLQGYSGSPIMVDRKNLEKPIIIERPALTIGLSVQPVTISSVVRNSTLAGRGLVDRFLFVQPESTLGRRNNKLGRKIANAPETKKAAETYVDTMVRLYEQVDQREVTLPLSPKAADLFDDWVDVLEPRLDPRSGDLATLSGWASKMHGNLLRIAALLHVAASAEKGKWPPPAIDEKSMKNAIEIANYLVEHAMTLRGVVAIDMLQADANQVLVWLRDKHKQPSVTRRQVMQANRNICSTAEEADRVMKDLAERGWIHRIPKMTRTGPGRPSDNWALHPSLLV